MMTYQPESTCNLVELCNNTTQCEFVTTCGKKNEIASVQVCTDSTKCVVSRSDVSYQSCSSDNCVPIESIDPCPPPPNCPMVFLRCPDSFTPVSDEGCIVGCPQCPMIDLAPLPPRKMEESPHLLGEPVAPPPHRDPVDMVADCENMVGAITVADTDKYTFKLEDTGESCRINDGLMYHGMWAPSEYDVMDTIDWVSPDALPCAKQWFVSGDLVCYCPCDQTDIHREPPRPFDPIAPSPPREAQKSPSPPSPPPRKMGPPAPPPRKLEPSFSHPPRKLEPPSPPPRKLAPPSPPPREAQKSPSPPPPRKLAPPSPHLLGEPVAPPPSRKMGPPSPPLKVVSYLPDYDAIPDVSPTLDADLIGDDPTNPDDPYIVTESWLGGNSTPGGGPGFLPPTPPPRGKTYGIETQVGIFTVLGVGIAALAAATYYTIRRNTHRPRPHPDHTETYNPLISP